MTFPYGNDKLMKSFHQENDAMALAFQNECMAVVQKFVVRMLKK